MILAINSIFGDLMYVWLTFFKHIYNIVRMHSPHVFMFLKIVYD